MNSKTANITRDGLSFRNIFFPPETQQQQNNEANRDTDDDEEEQEQENRQQSQIRRTRTTTDLFLPSERQFNCMFNHMQQTAVERERTRVPARRTIKITIRKQNSLSTHRAPLPFIVPAVRNQRENETITTPIHNAPNVDATSSSSSSSASTTTTTTTNTTSNQTRSKCCICKDAESNCLFTPCGHICTCTSCGLDSSLDFLNQCPICRKHISGRRQVFFS